MRAPRLAALALTVPATLAWLACRPPSIPTAVPPSVSYTVDEAHVRHLISLVGQPGPIAPYLAEGFEFREMHPPSPPQDKAAFLAGMARMTRDYTEMALAVDSVITHRPDSMEARGRFSALYLQRTRFNLHFAITMRFDREGWVVRWWDHFRSEAF